MWNVNPKKMCRKHLLAEHLEMHMFAGCIKKKKCIDGYITKHLVETHNIKKRHDALAKELIRRHYKHKTPLKAFKTKRQGKINTRRSTELLLKRCKECRARSPAGRRAEKIKYTSNNIILR